MLTKVSLRRQMAGMLFGLIMIAYLAFTVVNVIANIQLTKQELFKTQRSNLNLIENDIAINLALLEGEVESIGQFWLRDDTSLSSLEALLIVKSNSSPIFQSIWLMDTEGMEVARVESGRIVPQSELGDSSEREYFFKAARLEEGETAYSSMRAMEEGLALTVSRPLIEDGVLRGVIAASLRLSSFHDILIIFSRTTDVDIHLLDGDGRLLATSDNDAAANLTSLVYIPPVQQVIQHHPQQEIAAYRNMFDDRYVFGTAARVDRTGWILVIEHDRAAVYQEQLEAQAYNLIITGVIFLFALGASLYLSKQITDPLGRMIEKTHRMQQGDLSTPIEGGGSKELVELADSFNEMASQLDESMHGLKNRIALQEQAEAVLRQRTRELETLLEVTSTLTRTHDLARQLEYAASSCLELLNGDECCIVHVTANQTQYTAITRASALPFENISRAIGEQFIRATAPAIFNDIQQKEGIKDLTGGRETRIHLISAPLFISENQIGEILLVRLDGDPFDRNHLNLLAGVAQQTAQAIDALRMVEVLENYNTLLEKAVTSRTEELRTANEHLRKLSQLKDEFISNVSHELRTPLTNLKLRTYLLGQRPETLGKHLAVFDRETDRLQAIVENLLTIASLDQSQIDFHLEHIDLNDLVNEVAADRDLLIRSQGKYFDVEFDPTPSLITADRRMLEQVISILLTNAMNYTPEGGRITLATRSRQVGQVTQVGFSIADTGIGIKEDEKERLFERFFRGDAAEQTSAPGTGLGLSIARQIVDRHKGEIEITSSGIPGEGACFTVWLPRA